MTNEDRITKLELLANVHKNIPVHWNITTEMLHYIRDKHAISMMEAKRIAIKGYGI